MKRALTVTAIKHAKPREKPYKLADGGGLYLWITPKESKLWRYKFHLDGKEQTFSLGPYPELGLAEARVAHEAARQLVGQGTSPVAARRTVHLSSVLKESNAFQTVAESWIAEKAPHWSVYYAKQVRSTLERDVFPVLGKKEISDVSSSDLREIIKRVASRTDPPDGKKTRDRGATSVAVLIQQWCSAVFRHAVVNGLADNDPTFALKGLVTRPKVRHHKHLEPEEIPTFVERLDQFTGTDEVGLAIELLMLTFVRTGELRNATWEEFDLKAGLWRIPAHRMKMGRPHIVPLSKRARDLVEELSSITGQRVHLFPNQRSPRGVMSMTTINRALERLGYGGRLSGHGFRGTASTYLHGAGYPRHVIEKQLAHEVGNSIEASYNHAEYLAERRAMMEHWSEFVRACPNKVVPIRKTG